MKSFSEFTQRLIACERCPRLRKHCLKVAREKRRSFQADTYWGRPIPSFGDPKARLIIIGLAPAAHGANRTGRMFTGDRSGDWLYRALHKAGFASQPQSLHAQDGLRLTDAYITAAAHCAPPGNKPEPDELARCAAFLHEELGMLQNRRVYLALGLIALKAAWKEIGGGAPLPKFSHGGHMQLPHGRHLVLSYHPSQQNTFTGRLTEPMFDAVFTKAKSLLVND